MFQTLVQIQSFRIFYSLFYRLNDILSFIKFSIEDFSDILFAENDRRSNV